MVFVFVILWKIGSNPFLASFLSIFQNFFVGLLLLFLSKVWVKPDLCQTGFVASSRKFLSIFQNFLSVFYYFFVEGLAQIGLVAFFNTFLSFFQNFCFVCCFQLKDFTVINDTVWIDPLWHCFLNNLLIYKILWDYDLCEYS